MSENDTVEGAADKAAPEDLTEDAIWQREIERRKNPDADVDEQDDSAAPDEADTGTDTEVPEPVESKSSEGKAPKDAQKPETPNIDRLKGTIAGQNRKIAELQREIASYAKRAKDAGNDDITDLDGLRAEYPEVVGPLIDRLTRLEANLGDQRQQLSKMSELAGAQHTASVESEAARLDEMVPGWDRTINSDRKRFDDWINNPDNPRWVYDTFAQNKDVVTDADQVARLVSAYKQSIGAETRPQSTPAGVPRKPIVSRRLDGARATTSRGTQINSENDGGLTPEQIWEREAAKRAKLRQQG